MQPAAEYSVAAQAGGAQETRTCRPVRVCHSTYVLVMTARLAGYAVGNAVMVDEGSGYGQADTEPGSPAGSIPSAGEASPRTSEAQRYKQLANAVTANVIEAVAGWLAL